MNRNAQYFKEIHEKSVEIANSEDLGAYSYHDRYLFNFNSNFYSTPWVSTGKWRYLQILDTKIQMLINEEIKENLLVIEQVVGYIVGENFIEIIEKGLRLADSLEYLENKQKEKINH